MNASQLSKGDLFVEVSPEAWAEMTVRERNKLPRVTVEGPIGYCRTDLTRVHMRTSKGHWCIPAVAPVTLLDAAAVTQTRKAG